MTKWISAERLSTLIGLIYDCAIDLSQWPIAMEAIRMEIEGANASLDLVNLAATHSLLNITTNIPDGYRETLLEHPDEIVGLWGGIEVLNQTPLAHPITLLQTTPDVSLLETSRFANEWAKPQGLGDMLAVWLARDARAFGVLAFGRLVTDGPYGDRELEIMGLLAPHLQRAATINRLLDIAAIQQSNFTALFDALSTPIVLVGHEMRLAHANVAAQTMLDQGGPLRVRDGLISVSDLGADRALAAAIGQIIADPISLKRKGLGIPLRLDNDEVGALHVLPLASNHAPDRVGALAAVFVARSVAPFVGPTDIIAELFGLTPSEARVFEHIVGGHTVARIASDLGVESSTVKTHLLHVFDKTGVRRQADLVQMAATLAVPVLSSADGAVV